MANVEALDSTRDPAVWDTPRMTPRRSRAPLGVGFMGTGAYLPDERWTNRDLLDRYDLDTTDEWISTHTGIESRHIAPAGTATSDLAAEAARRALDSAGVAAADLDHILLCTTTPDWPSPAAASRVQQLLGARCPAEDKNAACASWIFGIDHGARLIATGCERVLVVGADVKSRFVGQVDHRLRPVLADGAAAVVLGPSSDGAGILQLELYTDGSKAENMVTPAGGSAMPASAYTVAEDLHTTMMRVSGQDIKRHAIAIMSGLVRQVCAQEGVSIDDIDVLIAHQANLSIMRGVAAELGVDEARVHVTIDHTGNIVAATLPYAFDHALRGGRIAPGALVAFATAGAGYAGGAMLYRQPDHAGAT